MERDIDFLHGVEYQSSPTFATLHGFRSSFKQNLNLKKFVFVIHDNHKRAVKAVHKTDSYPYGYFYINSMGVNMERVPPQNIKRFGDGRVRIKGMDAAIVSKSFLFPSKIGISCVYKTDNLLEAISFCERLTVISSTRLLSFDIGFDDGFSWNVNVVSNSVDLSIPQVQQDDEANANVFEITFDFVLESYIGQFRDVPKINNEGKVQTNVKVE